MENVYKKLRPKKCIQKNRDTVFKRNYFKYGKEILVILRKEAKIVLIKVIYKKYK